MRKPWALAAGVIFAGLASTNAFRSDETAL